MDINIDSVKADFEQWAKSGDHPETLWPVLWDAYWKGYMDAPQWPGSVTSSPRTGAA